MNCALYPCPEGQGFTASLIITTEVNLIETLLIEAEIQTLLIEIEDDTFIN